MAKDLSKGIEANFPHPDNFGIAIGYQVSHFDKEKKEARVTLEVQAKHLSPAGRVHGGVISALLDFTCGAATLTTLAADERCSTVELKVNYFHPLNLGDKLEARARVVFRGKRLCVLETFLFRGEDSDPVAMATATFNIYSESNQVCDKARGS